MRSTKHRDVCKWTNLDHLLHVRDDVLRRVVRLNVERLHLDALRGDALRHQQIADGQRFDAGHVHRRYTGSQVRPQRLDAADQAVGQQRIVALAHVYDVGWNMVIKSYK